MKSTKSEIIKHIPNTNLNDQSMPSECLESLTTRDSPVNSPENLNDPDPVTTFLNDPFTTNGSVTMVSSINQSIKNESGKGENIPSNAEKLLNSLIQDVSMQKAVSILDQPVSSDNQEDLLLHRVNIDLIQHLNEVEDHEEVSDLSSPPSPGMLSPTSRADMYSTDNVLADTQMSLCKKSEDLHLHDMGTVDTSTLWSIVSNQEEEALHPPSPDDGVHKSLKLTEISDAHTSLSVMATVTQTIPDSVFDAEGAVSSAQFVFTKFGSDVPGVFSFSAGSNDTITSSVITPRPTANIVETSNKEVENKVQVKNETPEPLAHSTVDPDCEVSTTTQTKSVALQQPPVKHLKEPSLNLTFPAKSQGCELKILKQPEDQHRARYMTEGSRGAIKDKSQQGHPIVKLLGCKKPVTLQVFIGTDTGKVKPHGFYQACKVCGKNSTQCSERDIEGTTVIELQLDPQDEMTVNIDCVGILKLRNADVEQRIGLARSKKKSTRARMVFRVNIPKADGSHHTLQVASMPISCTQPAGQPEICKKSLEKCSAEGGEELFIIGKNFTKGTKVVFEEKDDPTLWSAEGSIDMEYFQPGHLICKIPAYQDEGIAKPVEVQITVQASGRISEPHKFFYLPASHSGATDSTEEHAACSEPTTMTHVKEEVAMETDETMAPPSQSETPAPSMPAAAKTYVSPVALALNKMYEQAAQTSSSAPSVLSMNGNVCLTSQENGMDNMDDITHPTWATTQVPMQQDTLVAPELPPLQIQPQHQHCKIMKIDTESQSQMGQLVQSESSPGGSFGQIETSTTQMNSPQTASPEPVQQFSQQTTQVSSDSFQSQQFTSPAQPVTVQMLSSPQQLASPADQFNNLQAKIQVEADEQLQSQPSTCFTFQQVAPQAAQQVGQITPHIVSPEPVQQEVDRTQQGIQQVESQQQTFQQVGACQQQLAPQQQQQHEVQVVTQKLNLDLQQQTPELQAVLQQLINQRKQQLQPAAAATQPVQQATLLQNFMETDSVPQQQVFTNISQLNPQILQLNTQQQNMNPEPVQMTLPLASQKPLVSQVMNQAGQVLSQSKEVLPPQPTMFNIQVQNSQPSNAQAQISQQINAPPAQAQEGNSARNTVQQLLNSLQTSQMAPCQAQSQPTTVLQLLQQQSSAQQQVQQAQVQQTQVQQAQVQQTQVQQAQVQQAQVQQTQVQQAQVQQAQVQQTQVQQTQVQQAQVQQVVQQQQAVQQQAVQQQAVQQQQQAQVTQVQLAQAPPASNQQQAANQLVQQLQQILQQQKQPVTVVFAGHNSLPLNTALLTNTQLPQTTHTFSEGAQQPLLQQPNLANLVTPQQPVGGTTSLHQLLQQQVGGTTVLMTQPSTQSSAQNASTSIDTSSQRAMKRDVKGQPVSSPEVGRSPASELYTLLTSAAPSTTTNMPVMSRESNTSTPAMATSPITSANQVDTSHPSPVVTVNKQMPAASPKQEQPATSQQKWMETNQDTVAVGNTQPANPTGRSGLAEGGFPNIAVEDVDRLLNPGQMRSQMQ